MGLGRFFTKLHGKSSDEGSIDPNCTKKAIMKNTPIVTVTEKAIERVNAPVSVTHTVQARSDFGEQRHTYTPIFKQMEKLPLASDKVNDYVVANNTHDKTKGLVRDHNSRAIVEPVENYKLIKNKLDKPLATAPGQKQRYCGVLNGIPVHNPNYSSQRKSYEVINEKPSTLVHDQGYKSPSTKVDREIHYGPVENNIVTYKQVVGPHEVGKCSKNDAEKWRETDGADVYSEYADYPFIYKQVAGPHEVAKCSEIKGNNWQYREYTNYSNNYLDMPSNGIDRYEQAVEPYENMREWPRKEQRAIPPIQVTPLFGPTNDIGKALQFLEEAVITAPLPQYNNCCTESRIPLGNAYAGAIESNEAQWRLGNPNPSARLSYTGTISSTEAARKYG